MNRCERTADIEAARDRRWVGADGLRAHVTSCAECREEIRALDALGERLRADGTDPIDDLAVARLKQRLVRDLARPAASPKRRARAPWIAAAAIALVSAVAIGWPREEREAVRLVDEGSARYTRQIEGGLEVIDLVDGRLRIEVAGGAPHVLVRVPDGTIRDVGTIFHVEVADQRTGSVVVDEGMVWLDLEGSSPVMLGANERWSPAPIAPEAPVAPIAPVPAVAAPAAAPIALPRRAPSPPLPSAPTITSAEDDAYVEILRLHNAGQIAEAEIAARAYLRDFPDGFRRAEVGRLRR